MSKTSKLLGFGLTLFLLVYYLSSCQEKETKPINSNELRACIIKGAGDTTKILVAGDSAFFGCSILGTEMVATNANSAVIFMSVLASPSGCITQAGTYNFLCQYYKDKSNGSSAVFSNYESGGIKKGSITFTTVEKDFVDGHFHVVCQCEFQTNCAYGKDSVVIVGTFKANSF